MAPIYTLLSNSALSVSSDNSIKNAMDFIEGPPVTGLTEVNTKSPRLSCHPQQRPPRSAKLDPCVLAVKQHLEQDGHIDQDLDRTARPELSGALVQHEVGGLEDVSGRPQQHHLHAGAMKRQRGTLWKCEGALLSANIQHANIASS